MGAAILDSLLLSRDYLMLPQRKRNYSHKTYLIVKVFIVVQVLTLVLVMVVKFGTVIQYNLLKSTALI